MPRSNTRLFWAAAIMLAAVALTGCSTFNRDWRAAGRNSPARDGLAGRWQGEWKSDSNGHTGQLRCLVTKVNDSQYEARFRAHYFKILRFSYTTLLEVEEKEGRCHFKGEADLGKLAGGVYKYEGEARDDNFFSIYRSKYDHGTFRMTRVQ